MRGMTPYAAEFGVTAQDLVLYSSVRDALCALPRVAMGVDQAGKPIVLSCHIICRAMRKRIPVGVAVEDGYFANHYQHSWLRLQSGNILDLYPVAVASGPILWDGKFPSPAAKLFERAKLQVPLRFSAPEFRRAVRRVADALSCYI